MQNLKCLQFAVERRSYRVERMAEKEGNLIAQAQIEVLASMSKGNSPYSYLEEWVLWYLRSSNHISANTNIFKDVYFLCRDAVVPDTNAHDIF